jgi:type VI secretion system protein
MRSLVWVLVPLLLLCGCSANPRSFFGGEIELEIYTDAQLNQDSPVAVELIVVRDEKLLEKLLELKAQQWFEQREQFQRDHPGTKSFSSWYWELVPGQPLLTQKLEFDSGARAVVVFANYFSEGQHRVRAEAHQNLVIRLGKDDVTLEPKS